METTLQSLLDTGRPIITDGGMGTMLFASGLVPGTPPPVWNVERPEGVAAVHRAYIEAGAQIILTNTFVANRHNLSRNNMSERVREFNLAAVKIARAEAEAADHPVLVVGDIGPTGGIVADYGDMTFEGALDVFKEQASALAEAGVTAFWIETMSFGTPQSPTRTTYGVTHEQARAQFASLGVNAFGANCGLGIEAVLAVVETMHGADPAQALVAKANAGIPTLQGDLTVYPATPKEMGDYALRARALGATIIGACCGSTPEHIRAIAAALV
jgi:methionine synthase I (cobalamin-dependent)